MWKFAGKMPDPYSKASILCEPAQSKCTWTCHKKHFCVMSPTHYYHNFSVDANVGQIRQHVAASVFEGSMFNLLYDIVFR